MGGFGVIARWKIRREVDRFAQQLKAIPELFWEPFVRQRHDRLMARGFQVTQGAQVIGPKVAVVLLFQPNGLASSVGYLCRHLASAGYAILAVSNAPLAAGDRRDLAMQVWRIIERPNFGYDFGGYRDGLWHLSHWGIKPERLVILNDSIWFPLREGDTTLARMEAMPVDVAGTILRERGAERFLESYLFSMRGSVLQHPAFQAFWRDLRLTSNKYKVIRRGERGFGAALMAGGLTLAGLFTLADFEAGIARATDNDLQQILQFTAHQDQKLAAEGRALANQPRNAEWRGRAVAYLKRVTAQSLFYCTFPVAAVRLLDYPIMKKSREPISARWRETYVSAVQQGILPEPLPAILVEMQSLRTVSVHEISPGLESST